MPTPLNRRQFLQASAISSLGVVGLQSASAAVGRPKADSVILLNLVGGPSQLDTWDPKPAARSAIRGPFRPISTRVPGLQISELFPRMATMADRFTLLRGMHHTAAPIHELGQQLLSTGRTFGQGPEWPHLGAVTSQLLGERDNTTAWWQLGSPTVDTGISVGTGQGWGFLTGEQAVTVQALKHEDFQTLVLSAVMAVSCGARVVSINMFSTVFDQPSWDCHADFGSLSCDLNDYRETVAPLFDQVFTRLLTDLEKWGLLERTLVVATGEFGRTPRLNSNGGRDHWASAWTAIVAGGGTPGGRVIGSTDRDGAEPKDRPTTPQELHASMGLALGLPMTAELHGEPVFTAKPIQELWS